MKIWHLSSNRWNSAITEYALSTARALAMRGHESVFSPLANSLAEKRAKGYGLDCHSFEHFKLSNWSAVKKFAHTYKPDVVFCYEGEENFLLSLIPSLKIVRFRGRQLEPKHFRQRTFFRFAHRHVDLVLAPGSQMAQDLRQLLPKHRIEHLPLGIDTRKFYPKGEWVSPFTANNRPEIVLLARLDPVKGHREFLLVFAQLLKEWTTTPYPLPLLHFIGTEENLKLDELHWNIKACGLKLNEHVMITPHRVDDIATVLTRATLGVIPSLWSEEICRVAEEFLVCGTPILVSGVGALEDSLFPGAGTSYKGLSFPQQVNF